MKGKYASRAVNRSTAAEQEASEATYRRRVLKLTEERDAACAERDKARDALAKESRILRAQLAEGTSPRVEALTRELSRMREERDQLARWKKESREKYGAVFGRIMQYFQDSHGMDAPAAADAALRLCGGVSAETIIVDKGVEQRFAERFGNEAVLAIRKARGNFAPVSTRSVEVTGERTP